MRLNCAIFDMDGTLLDSMWKWDDLGFEILRRHGREARPDFRDMTVPMGMGAAAEKMMWTLNVPVLMRKLFPTMLFEGGLSRKRDAMIADMQNALVAQLENPDTRTKRMTGAIADAVVAQIAEKLQRAVVLLREIKSRRTEALT